MSVIGIGVVFMYRRLRFCRKCFVSKMSASIFAYAIVALLLLVLIMLGGCRASPTMSFEQDRPMNTSSEQDFFQDPLMTQSPPTELRDNRILRADYTEEATYLKNIVQLLEQSKILATHAQKQVRPQQPKVFNYAAFGIDIETIIFAVKRYLAADDYTPRGFEALPPIQLKGSYSDVE